MVKEMIWKNLLVVFLEELVMYQVMITAMILTVPKLTLSTNLVVLIVLSLLVIDIKELLIMKTVFVTLV